MDYNSLVKKENKTNDYLLFVAYCCYLMINLSFSAHLYIGLGLFVAMLSFSLRKKDVATATLRDIKLLFLLVYSCMILTEGLFVGGIVFTLKQFFTSFLFYSFFIFYHYFEGSDTAENREKVIKLCFALFAFFSVYNSIYYLLFPGAARRPREHALLLVSGYGLACACSILFVFIFGYLINGYFKDKPKQKRFVILLLILMAILIVLTQSTITMLIWIIGIVSCVYFRRENLRAFYFRIALLPFLLAVLIFLFSYLGGFLIEVLESRVDEHRMFERLYSLGHFMKYGTEDVEASYAINRFVTPFESVKTFFKSPIFGVAYKHGSSYLHPTLFGVANHSEFPDAFANYGVLGGLPFIFMYVIQIAEILKRKISHPSSAWIIVVVLLGCFNPLKYFAVNFVLFFFIPVLTKHMEDLNLDKEEEQS